ncbi:amidase [Evansella sp. AB-rgal1]|uniref:amidase n=1 Tax=Evansella sp. AB-rgal1 TaxID=3242696 RepID=UPI00359E5F1F
MKGFSYEQYDGIGLAELINSKEIKQSEVVEAAIARIERFNPSLNAVIHRMYDQAKSTPPFRENNRTAIFTGVPMLLKDITQEIGGEPITSGSKVFSSYISKQDSTYTKRIREAGALFLGQTNVPEFALMGITEPLHYGPTRNPWNTNHTPGGSSGGSAAAVASGMVPIAGANDGGGSIRIPASYCGLFGIKPSRGRTPVGPVFGRHWQGASSDHVLTRSVRDSAAMLDVLNYQEKGAAFSALPYKGSYLESMDTPTRKSLKIAYTLQSPLGTEVQEDCKEAVKKAITLLETLGHEVEEKDAPVDGKIIAKSYLTMYFGEVAATLASAERVLGRKVKMKDVEPTTWLLGLIGNSIPASEFVLNLRDWDKAAYAMEEFHEEYDLYVTPTTAFLPAKIGEMKLKPMENFLVHLVGRLGVGNILNKTGVVHEIAEKNLMRTPFTQLANLTGQPAMTVPLHITKDGLPCGTQFMASRGKEELLFQVARLLEQTELWIDVKNNNMYESGR